MLRIYWTITTLEHFFRQAQIIQFQPTGSNKIQIEQSQNLKVYLIFSKTTKQPPPKTLLQCNRQAINSLFSLLRENKTRRTDVTVSQLTIITTMSISIQIYGQNKSQTVQKTNAPLIILKLFACCPNRATIVRLSWKRNGFLVWDRVYYMIGKNNCGIWIDIR